jgi:LPS-assembly protein
LFLKVFFLINILSFLPVSGQTTLHVKKADLPPEDEIWLGGITQTSDSELKHLRGGAYVHTSEMSISADEIDFNSDTDWAYARGRVRLEHYATGDILNADHAEYNIRTEEGKFYAINGTAPAKILTSPGVLTTTNPFYFQALWADRIKNRYVLHHGFITDCKMPKPWWTFQSPKFDVVPGEHAIARHAVLYVHHIPVLYLPYYLRPLGRNPRQSGFLTPNIGNSSLRGYMIGGGYYWAINRSYDMDYVLQYFTLRGPAHTVNFRGKPNDVTDFNLSFYAVQDKGLVYPGGTVIKEGGEEGEFTGKTKIWGFTAKVDYNFLSSYIFRQSFANSYNTALSSEVSSIGFLQRHFDHDIYSLNFVFQRDQLFEAATLLTVITPSGITPPAPKDDVVIQKLPSVEFFGRDNQIDNKLPLWLSISTSAGLFRREESDYLANGTSVFTLDTGLIMPRVDVEPRVSTAFKFFGFSLIPSFTFGLTDYGKDYSSNSTTYVPVNCSGYPSCAPGASAYNVSVQGTNLLRHDSDFVLGFYVPPIERIFTPPAWLHMGAKLKHVVELNATYENVAGIDQFQRVIHFDQTDILSNTNQLTFDLTNRIYKKDKAGHVTDLLNWHVMQAHYFDPTFGGAVVAGQRNEVLAALELSPDPFLNGPRSFSPIESAFVLNPYQFISFEYRTAYDPVLHRFVDHAVTGSFRKSKLSVNVSDTAITTIPLLIPQANQLGFGGSWGTSTRKGWNVGGNITYDLLLNRSLFQFAQATYNTDCCGFSFQLRRFDFGNRDEKQYLFSFSLANLGTFGSMQKQDRIF